MDKLKIVDALCKASMYIMDNDEFLRQITEAGVKSYLIDIYDYTITFKGLPTAFALNSNDFTISLLRKKEQVTPLFIELLKKEDITRYEVILENGKMLYYDKSGREKFLS